MHESKHAIIRKSIILYCTFKRFRCISLNNIFVVVYFAFLFSVCEPHNSIIKNNSNSICEVNKLKINSRQSSDSVNEVNNYSSDCDDAIFTPNTKLTATKTPATTASAAIIVAANKFDINSSCGSSNSTNANNISRSNAITPSKSPIIVDNDLENNSNTIQIDIDDDIDCEKLNTNLERAPLLQLSPNKSITLLNKQNSTSLIFTKKDTNPVVHRKRIALVRSSGNGDGGARTSTELTTAATTLTHQPREFTPSTTVQYSDEINSVSSSPKKRHSFHWHSERSASSFIPTEKLKRKQIKSWYAAIATPSVKEATFEHGTEV